jgi:penicillin amidase
VKSKRKAMMVLKGLVSLLVLSALCVGLGKSYADLSPLGQLLAPSTGVWRHKPTSADDLLMNFRSAVASAGMKPVTLTIDSDGVPHLASDDEAALYFAQGYITAYYRMWQMDFLSRITAGRVAELLGEKALPIDRFFRRLKVPAAAEASAELMLNDLGTRNTLIAYSNGVNTRLQQIGITNLPFEYRLFGTLPEPWEPKRVAYLLKFMTWELTGYMYDFRLSSAKTKLSSELFDLLFPIAQRVPGTVIGDKDSAPIAKSTEVGTQQEGASYVQRNFNLFDQKVPEIVRPDPTNGSNNWAIAGKHMANGRPALSNDLHLSYTLPALWFPIQLTGPDFNVYGASLPGAPGVIVGFNEDMGWAVTNGTNDVLDWYSLRFRDETRREYLFEDSWRPVILAEEKILLPDERYEIVQTRETHIGPILFEEGEAKAVAQTPSGLALQWTGLIPSNELKSFLALNRAKKASDCRDALKGYVAPAQNFVCADQNGTVTYRLAGLFPDRRSRDGRLVSEASKSSDVWQGFLPPENNPAIENARDLVITANQAPFNGTRQSDYGWFFATPYRAMRIDQLINAKIKGAKNKGKLSPEDLIEIQADTGSLLSIAFKDLVLKESKAAPLADQISNFRCRPVENLAMEIEKWTGIHNPDSVTATLMSEWLARYEQELWQSRLGTSFESYWPNRWRLLEISQNPGQWSNLWNESPKSVAEVLSSSLNQACTALLESHAIVPSWSKYQETHVQHSGRIPGLGRRNLQTGGSAESVFANKGGHGPTWKMVVTFEDTPRAWFMIPGGQSGDPGSVEYDRYLTEWGTGKMRQAQFFKRYAKSGSQ